MGALVPSSRACARAMVGHASICDGQVVVELGGGNGAFTQEIVARHPANPLIIFEISPSLGQALAKRFPAAKVVVAPAETLPDVAPGLVLRNVDRVVSGLPLALWNEARQTAMLDSLLPFLSPDARFVTLHYLHSRLVGRVDTTRRLLQERFAHVTDSPPVWTNFPPAYIHIAASPRLVWPRRSISAQPASAPAPFGHKRPS
jgi:phospholipid N-methyltransferase